jgi:hypothetical protein
MYETLRELRPTVNPVYDFYYKKHARFFKEYYPKGNVRYSVFEEHVYTEWKRTTSDWRALEKFEEKYKLSLGQLVIGDVYHEIFGSLPYYNGTDLDWYRRYALICFRYYEEILNEEAVDAVVYEAPNSVPTRELYSGARRMGIPAISLYASLFENRMYFGMDESGRNMVLDHYCGEAPSSRRERTMTVAMNISRELAKGVAWRTMWPEGMLRLGLGLVCDGFPLR